MINAPELMSNVKKRKPQRINEKVLLVTSEMGLGHLRANAPYAEYLKAKLIIHGQSKKATFWLRLFWNMGLKTYTWLSRSSQLPVVGIVFRGLLNSLLSIPPLTKSPSQQKSTFPLWLVERAVDLGACNELEELHKYQQVITTFYPAITYYAKKRPWVDVFCQICDTDLSRVWVAPNPRTPNIHYFATCRKTVKRLQSYGVPRRKITLSGFPFPHSLVGGEKEPIARENYKERLNRLDCMRKHHKDSNPLSIVYSIGGAGAQLDVGIKAIRSLDLLILRGDIKLTMVAPPKSRALSDLMHLKKVYYPHHANLIIMESSSLKEYFTEFTKIISTTDVLWTKPGELSFYASLGIPVIMAPPIGPQEVENRKWLMERDAGIDQGDPDNTKTWLPRLLQSGALERMAKNGWTRGIRTGLYTAVKVIQNFTHERKIEKTIEETEYMLQE